MNEKAGKRRDWVKNAAIVFLTIMLILTFFSNTIMNYSLPEVAIQYIQSGTITSKVRGTGTVQSSSLYNVKVTESRKVTSVAVKVGDTVAEGDVICYLDEKESTELQAAKDALRAAQVAYDTALLSGSLTATQMQNGGKDFSVDKYKKQLINAQNAITAAQQEIDAYQPDYDAIKKANDDAQTALTTANNNLANIEAWMGYQDTISSGNAVAKDKLKKQYTEAKQLALAAQNNANVASAALAQADASMKVLTDKLDAAKASATELATDIGANLNLNSLYEAVVTAQNNVDELTKNSQSTTITADIAGTITSVSVTAGEQTSPDTPVAVIQPEGKGYTLSFSATAEQAAKISVGDPAELVNSWYYSDITATVASIKPDPQDRKNKVITFNLSGDLTEGQSLSLQVGQKSANYDYIVPNSAIREDNNGKFVLIVESKSSPLGTRYYATRYDVQVLASDDTQTAISGGFYGYESVITTSTKPVEAGKLVRLPD